MMIVPPTISHQRIADNLTRLLNDALAKPTQRGRLFPRRASNLERRRWHGSAKIAAPEPDVLVMDADYESSQRFIDRACLLADIVSDAGNRPVPAEKALWIDIKRRLFLAHPPCEAVIPTDSYCVDVRTDLRAMHEWMPERRR